MCHRSMDSPVTTGMPTPDEMTCTFQYELSDAASFLSKSEGREAQSGTQRCIKKLFGPRHLDLGCV